MFQSRNAKELPNEKQKETITRKRTSYRKKKRFIMSTHRYTSRGRTKQPKNLVLSHHTGSSVQAITYAHFKASGSAPILANANSLNDLLNDATAAENGYNTENQQYLHLCLRTTGSSVGNFSVYAYNRQFGLWGKLRSPVKLDSTTTNGAYVPTEFTSSASSVEYLTLPIHGIDRVAFVGTANDLILYAAGSTI